MCLRAMLNEGSNAINLYVIKHDSICTTGIWFGMVRMIMVYLQSKCRTEKDIRSVMSILFYSGAAIRFPDKNL